MDFIFRNDLQPPFRFLFITDTYAQHPCRLTLTTPELHVTAEGITVKFLNKEDLRVEVLAVQKINIIHWRAHESHKRPTVHN